MKEVFKLQADVCKTLANAKRLEIIYILKDGEKSAGEIVSAMGISKANVSQHLSVLRGLGVLISRREGVNIYYVIANPKIIEACTLMREVMLEGIQAKNIILKKVEES